MAACVGVCSLYVLCVKTYDYMLWLTDGLQFSCHGLFDVPLVSVVGIILSTITW